MKIIEPLAIRGGDERHFLLGLVKGRVRKMLVRGFFSGPHAIIYLVSYLKKKYYIFR
jgi:hypothetical protein